MLSINIDHVLIKKLLILFLLFLLIGSFLRIITDVFNRPNLPQTRSKATGQRTNIKILIPLYSYPSLTNPVTGGNIWDEVALANQKVEITAIINPNSGPVVQPDGNYIEGMNKLKRAGVTMIGYIYTSQGARNINLVKADIDLYRKWELTYSEGTQSVTYHPISGIFLDEASNDTADLNYYKDIYAYAKTPGDAQLRPMDMVSINPGTNIDKKFIEEKAADTAVIFEDYGSRWPNFQSSNDLSQDSIAALIHSVPNDIQTMISYLNLASEKNFGYVYATDDLMNNPWDTLPSFWQEEVNYISLLNASVQPSETPIPSETLIPTSTITPVPTSTPTPTTTPTRTPTPSATPTEIPTVTPAPTATATPVPTLTSTPIPTATTTPIPSMTSTLTPTPTTACQKASGGDLNCDGFIDEADLTVLVQQWYSPANGAIPDCTVIPTPGPSFSDANLTRLKGGSDCRVDEGDVSVLLLNWSPRPNP